eukprot:GHRQ01028807.1.p1 GENE.GHRQ01028807.1~~GHRQ01028807.1.p1  ORF type:complete len:107 (-),score=7.35 GHRQ01028807.1:436-756(-)
MCAAILLVITLSDVFMVPTTSFQPSDTMNCCSLVLHFNVRSSMSVANAKRVAPGLSSCRFLSAATASCASCGVSNDVSTSLPLCCRHAARVLWWLLIKVTKPLVVV